jgi:nucleoid DNA-binding protein/cell division septation protein DedD
MHLIFERMSTQARFGAAIVDLLYEKDQVHLPGLGAFVLQYKPALADAVQGQVLPPAREIQFNPNLVMDDGVLVQYFQQHSGLEAPEARDEVYAFVSRMKAQLENREIVELPGIGRFYMDYENKLRFLSDSGNYDKNAYGLPAIQAYPIIRQPAAAATTTPSYSAAAPVATSSSSSSVVIPAAWLAFARRYASWLTALALAVAIGVVLAFWPDPEPAVVAEQPNIIADEPNLPTERLNVKPSEGGEDAANPIPEEEENTESTPNAGVSAAADPSDTEAPTLPPNLHSAVVAVGKFGNTDNASRLIRRLAQAGYEPYSAQEGRLTRVGIQLSYRSDTELQRKLADIRRQYGSGAFVFMKDGELVNR